MASLLSRSGSGHLLQQDKKREYLGVYVHKKGWTSTIPLPTLPQTVVKALLQQAGHKISLHQTSHIGAITTNHVTVKALSIIRHKQYLYHLLLIAKPIVNYTKASQTILLPQAGHVTTFCRHYHNKANTKSK